MCGRWESRCEIYKEKIKLEKRKPKKELNYLGGYTKIILKNG